MADPKLELLVYRHLPSSWNVIYPNPKSERISAMATLKRLITQVYEWQHPINCSDKHFLIWGWESEFWSVGPGSEIHIMSYLLALAIIHNRIFILNPEKEWPYTDRDYCGSTLNIECFVLPITNCTLPTNSSHLWGNTTAYLNTTNKYLRLEIGPWESRNVFSFQTLPQWNCTLSLWRIATISYFLRWNDRLMSWLSLEYNRLFSSIDPTRSISMHIRHGDKWKEMRVHPLADYLEVAAWFKDEYGNHSLDTILLSSEDPVVFNEIQNNTNWKVYYNPNSPKVTTTQISPRDLAQATGPSLFSKLTFLNLELNARGFAYVGTTQSNWCRLINSLRIMRGYSHAIWVDLESGYW